MPLYDQRCPEHGDHEVVRLMSDGSPWTCETCHGPAQRVFLPGRIAHFTEDRLRFWKGPMHNGYSTALGAQMPETKSERDRMAKEKGVEFCSLPELLADNKEAADAYEYRKHVDSGGERNDPVTPDTSHVWKAPD